MALKKQKENKDFIAVISKRIPPPSPDSDFVSYQNIRTDILSIFRGLIAGQSDVSLPSMSNAYNFYTNELEILVKIGAFHEAYFHNLILSAKLFLDLAVNDSDRQAYIDIVDLYVRPKSKKTEKFRATFEKAMSGILAYILSNLEGCSEHLAILISNQAFGIKSEKTTYDALTKVKAAGFNPSNFSNIIMLALFISIFERKIDWNKIKPRAKQARSERELSIALESLFNYKKRIILDQIIMAKSALEKNPSAYEGKITPEFFEYVRNYPSKSIPYNDEMACVVLFINVLSGFYLSNLDLPQD
jgi:hypothetical protein